MIIDQPVGFIGEVSAYVFDGDLEPEVLSDPARLDALIADRVPDAYTRNMVTNLARQQMVKRIIGESANGVGYIGLSTSATTPSLTALALTDEIFRKATSINASYLTYYMRYGAYYATSDFGSTGIAGEGLFDTASTGGTMWAITSLSVSKTTTQSLLLIHLIQATS